MNYFLASLIVIGAVLAAPAAAQPDVNGAGRMAATERTHVAGIKSGSAMHWMAFNGDAAGVKELIVAGEDVNGRLKTGGTPLHLAAYKGQLEVARVLIEHGAQVDAKTREGVTPLDWAQRNGHEKVAMLLIAHGAGQSRSPSKQPPVPLSTKEQQQQEKEQDKEKHKEQVDTPDSVERPQPDMPLQEAEGQVPAAPPEQSNEKTEKMVRPEPPATAVGYRIQLGAFSSEQRAREAWAGYRKKYPDELEGRELIIDRASVKGKDYHRVQAGPMSRQDAWDICNRLKQTSQACAVMRRASP